MAAPLIALLPMIGKSMKFVLSKWQNILAFAGFAVATSFSINMFLNQVVNSILSLWPLLSLACLFLLIKEFIRGWITIRSKEVSREERV